MGVYDATRVDEVSQFVRYAEAKTPNWVTFQDDEPVGFKRIVHWLLNDLNSPLGWTASGERARQFVVQWQNPAGEWVTKTREAQLWHDGTAHGRLRFRKPRVKEER